MCVYIDIYRGPTVVPSLLFLPTSSLALFSSHVVSLVAFARESLNTNIHKIGEQYVLRNFY